MIIPETVRIGSYDYKVEFTEDNLLIDHSECAAYIDFYNHLIKINTVMGDIQQQEQAFLHELVHGIVDDKGLKFNDLELVVDELAKGLHQVIRDNKVMFLDEVDFELEEEIIAKE